MRPDMKAFRLAVAGELEKEANLASHATELAGLGILAKPSIDELRGKKQSEKKKAIYETAGLGILAAPSAFHLAKGAWKRFHRP